MLRTSLLKKFKVSSLHKAVRNGDVEKVTKLIEAGVHIDSPDGYDDTPLFIAIYEHKFEVAAMLINRNCNINLRNSVTRPAILAAQEGGKDIVELLLRRGDLQVSRVDFYGRTLLHVVSSNYGWTEIMRLILLNKEVNVDAADNEGETPLFMAAKYNNKKAAALLISAGADINKRNVKEKTALHWAVYFFIPSGRPHGSVVPILMEKEELQINPQDVDGNTPLHDSCSSGSLGREVRKQLLDAGADINVKNYKNKTALQTLIEDGIGREESTLEEIKLFVEKEAFFKMDWISIFFQDILYLKNNLLVDVEFCTRSVVNQFNNESVPALYITYANFGSMLPPETDLKLGHQHISDVKDLVLFEIQRNSYCDLDKIRPRSLSALCVFVLITPTVL